MPSQRTLLFFVNVSLEHQTNFEAGTNALLQSFNARIISFCLEPRPFVSYLPIPRPLLLQLSQPDLPTIRQHKGATRLQLSLGTQLDLFSCVLRAIVFLRFALLVFVASMLCREI
jgi:hypothetical protein